MTEFTETEMAALSLLLIEETLKCQAKRDKAWDNGEEEYWHKRLELARAAHAKLRLMCSNIEE
jgi:hypothetical protein